MDLEIRHLRLIQAIAQEGNMTRAARALRLTQPALSHQLTGLEAQLRTKVFERSPRGMVLTPAGDRLLESARLILEELGRAQTHLEGDGAEGGTIRLATECYTCYHWLPARIRRLRARFPQVEVQIVVEATRRPIDALLAREIDVAIVSAAPTRKGLRIRRLFEDELIAIVSPEHRLAGRPWLRAADFATETLLTYSVPLPNLTVFKEFLTPGGVIPTRVCQFELTEAIVEMVKANLGIAVLARWAALPHLGSSLRAMQLNATGLRRHWCAVTLNSKPETGYRKLFLESLAEDGLVASG